MKQSTSANNQCWFIFQNDRLLLANTGEMKWLIPSDALTAMQHAFVRSYHLTTYRDFNIFCAELESDFIIPDELSTIAFKKALELVDYDWYTIAVKAYMIINWDKNHRFCGRCGHATQHNDRHFERSCPACSMVFYPRISPSIIVAILRDDKLLMARGPHFPPGVYGLIAGFVEPGESVENAVHREVMEEVGIKVDHLTYFGSQAWPFPDSLMIAYTATYKSGELHIDRNELEDAGWYRYDALPGRPSSTVSISGKLLDHCIHLLSTTFK